MGTGLNRREQWGLIGVLILIGAGLGTAAWRRLGRDEARLVYVPGQGRWEKLADFSAGPAAPPSAVSRPAAPAKAPAAGAPQAEPSAAPPGGLDLNRASAAELERLPGIGSAKARAIVDTRARAGGFASLEQLDTVPGIGAKTIERLRPFVALTPTTLTRSAAPTPSPRPAPTPPAPTPKALVPTPGPVVDINAASAEQLEILPGVGPVLARRIVEERAARGPFRNPRELIRIQGIGPRNLEKMLPQIVAGPAR